MIVDVGILFISFSPHLWLLVGEGILPVGSKDKHLLGASGVVIADVVEDCEHA